MPFARVGASSGGGAALRAGIEIGVRPWPGDLPGERWVWVDAARLRPGAPAPLGAGPLRSVLRAATMLIVAGPESPFPDEARGRRGVILEVE